MKITKSLDMMTCIFHPKNLAVIWSGHIHVFVEGLGDIEVGVGRCYYCRRNKLEHTNYESSCAGCYGRMTGLR